MTVTEIIIANFLDRSRMIGTKKPTQWRSSIRMMSVCDLQPIGLVQRTHS